MAKAKAQWKFVNITLTEQEKTEFEQYRTSVVEDFEELVEQVLRAGYKMSHRYDDEHDSWLTTLTGTEFSLRNDNTSMSSRHGSFILSVLLALYKHLVVCDGGEWRDDSSVLTWG